MDWVGFNWMGNVNKLGRVKLDGKMQQRRRKNVDKRYQHKDQPGECRKEQWTFGHDQAYL